MSEIGKKKQPPHEVLKIDDFPPLPDELVEELGLEQQELPPLTIEDIRYISMEHTAMRVLRFMYKTRDAHYPEEIARILGMWSWTVGYQLELLHKIGLLSKRKTVLNKVITYYRLINVKGAEITIKRNLQFLATKLAKLVPLAHYRNVRELKQDKEFNTILKKWGLTLDEAMKAISRYYKIETITERGEIKSFRRKQQ